MQGLPVALLVLLQGFSSSGFHVQTLYVQRIPKPIDLILVQGG